MFQYVACLTPPNKALALEFSLLKFLRANARKQKIRVLRRDFIDAHGPALAVPYGNSLKRAENEIAHQFRRTWPEFPVGHAFLDEIQQCRFEVAHQMHDNIATFRFQLSNTGSDQAFSVVSTHAASEFGKEQFEPLQYGSL